MSRKYLAPFALTALAPFAAAATPPAPYGPVPSERQMAWHGMETYAFIHFGLNTYTGREWGYGNEDPKLFNPADFDADKIVAALKAGGMKGVILTAKHHDGFCLWPTKSTPHNITQSPFRGGKGDLVKEVSDACKKAGLKFGVYVSPWDRNNPEYGRAGYVAAYHTQIRELLTGYGELFEVWFDGANGGDGWYGGTKEQRKIDSHTYYGWKEISDMIRQYQPKAVIWGGDRYGDVHWVGNEEGFAPEVSSPVQGDRWNPTECDVSIRPGWFWHESQNAQVKTPRKLMDLYYSNVGHGSAFLLNVPPDNKGEINAADRKALAGFEDLRTKTFSDNLAKGAVAAASATRGGDAAFGAAKLLDDDRDSYWSTDDGVTDASVTLTLPEARTFDVVRLREALASGIRIENWAVDVMENGAWREYAKGKTIGNCRLVHGARVSTDKVRLRLSGGKVCPCLSEFSLFAEPVSLAAPVISRDRAGLVTLVASGTTRYTTDGSEPGKDGARYEKPFPLPHGGTVKARVFDDAGKGGDTAAASFGMAKAKWRILAASAGAQTAAAAIDDNPKSLWYTHEKSGRKAPPQSVAVDMGEPVAIAAFLVSPRADGADHGLVDRYRFEVSDDGATWRKVAEGEFSNIRANPVEQTVKPDARVSARYFRFTGLHCVAGDQVAVGELGVIPAE